jgi:serine/threonine-protein kinase HipA
MTAPRTAAGHELLARFGERLVGRLHAAADGRMAFSYDEAWVRAGDAFAVSLSLPLATGEIGGTHAHAFFANLLPEGGARVAVCRRLGISVDNDFALLAAIGRDCAGALSIVDPSLPAPAPGDYEYEELSDRALQALVKEGHAGALLFGAGRTRLSLAGAQDKLPVAVLDGRIHLPLRGAPSTHILKLPSANYKHVTANEAYVSGLAARTGLDTVSTELLHRTTPPVLLVERYDRRRTDQPWPAVRLHQEDLCQALGLPPTRKYEQEGGPGLAALIELVRGNVREPLRDVRRLIEWQAYNVVAGNSDGHAKNLSLVMDEARPRLAPFYDLLSTRAWPELDRELALAVGGERDPDRLTRARWVELALALQIRAPVMLGLARDVAVRCLEAIEGWTRAFRAEHGNLGLLQTLPRQITKRAQRMLRELK